MKVNLISYTADAVALLLYTKNTRLQGAKSLNDIRAWSSEHQQKELDYMRNTIKSSWEFVDYVFHIQEVTRAFTHQLVRTRAGSYAQESQRTVDVRDNGYKPWTGDPLSDKTLESHYDFAMNSSVGSYLTLLEMKAHPQDARGVLPTNIYTSIVAKFSLRTLHEMALVRLCTRTQGEYQDVFRLMKEAVVAVHPWAEDFIHVQCVWDGTCAFPNYKECPIQYLTFQATGVQKGTIREAHQNIRHEAQPVVKDGRTM